MKQSELVAHQVLICRTVGMSARLTASKLVILHLLQAHHDEGVRATEVFVLQAQSLMLRMPLAEAIPGLYLESKRAFIIDTTPTVTSLWRRLVADPTIGERQI